MNFSLTGKVAVITGGTGALGAALCHGIAQAGAVVVVVARSADRTNALAASIQGAGGEAIGVSADVLDKTALERAYESIMAQFGRVDLLVNGAGGNIAAAITSASEPVRSFFDLSQDALEAVTNLNLMGSVLPSQVFACSMVEQQAGAILNISSMAAQRPLTRVIGYSAAKAAIENFTRWLAVHMAMQYSPQIRVNAIAPGFFLGDQNRHLLTVPETSELTARGRAIIDHTPMRRFGQPEDLVGTAVWLLSDAAQFVTGIVVPVDGGFSAFAGV